MVLSAHLPRSAPLLVGVALVLAGLFVGACDLLTGSSQGVGSESGSSGPANATLAYSSMPRGASLPSPEEVPLKNGTVQAYKKSQGALRMGLSQSPIVAVPIAAVWSPPTDATWRLTYLPTRRAFEAYTYIFRKRLLKQQGLKRNERCIK